MLQYWLNLLEGSLKLWMRKKGDILCLFFWEVAQHQCDQTPFYSFAIVVRNRCQKGYRPASLPIGQSKCKSDRVWSVSDKEKTIWVKVWPLDESLLQIAMFENFLAKAYIVWLSSCSVEHRFKLVRQNRCVALPRPYLAQLRCIDLLKELFAWQGSQCVSYTAGIFNH